MICEHCHTTDSSIALTKVINGKKVVLNLCKLCAQQQTTELKRYSSTSIDLNSGDLSKKISSIANFIAQSLNKELAPANKSDFFSPEAKVLFEQAFSLAKQFGHESLINLHLLLAFLKSSQEKDIFTHLLANTSKLQQTIEKVLTSLPSSSSSSSDSSTLSQETRTTLSLAKKHAHRFKEKLVSPEHLILSIAEDKKSKASKILKDFQVSPIAIKIAIVKNSNKVLAPLSHGNKGLPNTPALDHFSTDLTALAAEEKLDPLIGRKKEVDRLIHILCRRTKNNPVLLGEPGVGKTAIVEGLAQHIVNGQVPDVLTDKRVIALDLTALVAGTKYRGEFEERIHKVLEDIKSSHHSIILFIDEMHTVIGAGSAEGTLDGANILKPDLAKGNLQCIGATTLEEYRKHIEKDRALERRFQTILVEEPSIEETITMLKGLRKKYEDFHEVVFTDEAIEKCVTLSKRYIHDRFLPDKAIDCMDEAAVQVHLSQLKAPEELRKVQEELSSLQKKKKALVDKQDYEQAAILRDDIEKRERERNDLKKAWDEKRDEKSIVVAATHVEKVITQWTSIPTTTVDADEHESLKNLKERLSSKVLGQDDIVESIANAIQKARLGLTDHRRPSASFLFMGPTGVGKTYLAKTLAQELFGTEDALVKIDMSEYMEQHSVAKLIGSPPGYVGYDQAGQLTEKIRRKPYAVLLLDELEKAHTDIYHLFLQILEDGELTDATGRKVSFKNTIIIATSNIGGSKIQQALTGKDLGFSRQDNNEPTSQTIPLHLKKNLREDLKKHFNPEFLGRLDEILFFNTLSKEHIEKIVELSLQQLQQRVKHNNITISFTPIVKQYVAERSFHVGSGARKVRQEIAHLEKLLASSLLDDTIGGGDDILVDVIDDALSIQSVKKSLSSTSILK